jgi:hypothetical protein
MSCRLNAHLQELLENMSSPLVQASVIAARILCTGGAVLQTQAEASLRNIPRDFWSNFTEWYAVLIDAHTETEAFIMKHGLTTIVGGEGSDQWKELKRRIEVCARSH